ncbi:NAD-dependent deacylase [Mycolicibacterium goodii]|nr:NAD-dependent deacylase [Mycolicibacterium goodii]
MSLGIVILTGAGVSVESGLAGFRGPDGLWEGYPVADVATPEGFAADPGTVQRFYNGLRRRLNEVEPNAAHAALARLERELGDRNIHLVTQNIDDLHQRAGSTAITAMHGELRAIRHVVTGEVRTCTHDVPESELMWRPHVVWFGERTIGLDGIAERLSDAGMFIAIGTSGTVYPANQFAAVAKAAGAITVEINTEPTAGPFDQRFIGAATQHVPQFVDRLVQCYKQVRNR